MPAKIRCPKCRLEMRVPDDFAGKTVKCPQCYERFRVPSTPTSPTVSKQSASKPNVSKPAPKYDDLVQQSLQAEVIDPIYIDDDEPALQPQPHLGPSHFWQCPHCHARCEKQIWPAHSQPGAKLGSEVRCDACGLAQSLQQIHAGVFDVPEIEITCARCRTPLVGPPDALLGQPCPTCQSPLPKG